MEKVFDDAITQEIEKYVYILKHEIKNPVLAQIHALEYLLRLNNINLRDEQKELLELTLESCHRQCEILDMLILSLNYRKGVVSLNKENVNLVSFLNRIFEDNDVEFYCDEDSINVYLDKIVFENVLCGILSSASVGYVNNRFCEVFLYKKRTGFSLVFSGYVCENLNEFKINSLNYKPIGVLAQKELYFTMLRYLGFEVCEQVVEDKYNLTINYA